MQSSTPTCLKCQAVWSTVDIVDVLGKQFLNKTYRDKRASDLLARERSLIPYSQERMAVDAAEAARRASARTRMREARGHVSTTTERPNQIDLRSKTVYRCPQADCNGFIVSGDNNHVCGICHTQTCHMCREVTTTSHTCDPNSVESIKLLIADTKQCPSCNTPIHRIDGCNHMFCVSCHNGFNWKTLKPMFGQVVNPHAFEYYRNQGNQDREADRGAVRGFIRDSDPDIPMLYTLPEHLKPFQQYLKIVRSSASVVGTWDRTAGVAVNDRNHDIRVKYLTNKMSEKAFVDTLLRRSNKSNLSNDLVATMIAFVEKGIGLLRAKVPQSQTETAIGHFENIIHKIRKAYGSKRAIPISSARDRGEVRQSYDSYVDELAGRLAGL